ncbi:Retrovirus-related Pol polyprotein from transposon TNT 1-94 [Linum grandiflorum]
MNPPASESSSLNVRFNGKNYALWSFQFRFLIAGKELLSYLDGSVKKPADDATATAKSTWETRNAQVFSMLLGSMEPNIALTLRTYTCAATVWKYLAKRYSQTSSSRTFEIEYELAQLHQGDLDIQSFHLVIQNLWTEQDLISTQEVSSEVLDVMLKERNKARAVQFLMKLRPEFESTRLALIAANTVNFDTIIGDLVRVETRLRTQAHMDGSTAASGSVFTARQGRPQFTRPPHGSTTSGELKCRHCGDHGHHIANCKKRNYCNYCRRPGHIILECRNRQRNDARFCSPAVSSGNANRAPQATSARNTSYSAVASADTSVDIHQMVRAALSEVLPSAIQSAFATFGVNGKPRPWLLDSAAFNHMTGGDRSVFRTYNSVPHMAVQVASGETLPVSGIDRVSTQDLNLPNTLHVPKLVPNLISVGQLTENGCLVSFSPAGCSVQDLKTRIILGIGSKNGRNFQLHRMDDSRGECEAGRKQRHQDDGCVDKKRLLLNNVFSLNSVSPSVKKWGLWHAHLGHPHSTRFRLIFQQRLIPSTINFKEIDDSVSSCVHCIEAKTAKLPFSKSSTHVANPFDLIHTDVWGPSPVTSRLGFRYFELFIDHATRFTWVYMLRHKSDLGRIAQEFIIMVHTQFNTTIKTIRYDPGGEYNSNVLHEFYRQHGIIFQQSCPGVSEQNGIIERKNRHVMELARALLLSSHVPQTFWPEVVQTVVYSINCQISNTLQNKSPFSVLYNKQPRYSRLRTFGCTCFVLVPRHERTKLTAKTIRCAFMGYSDHHKGYLCYDSTNCRMRIAYHVVFIEHVPYYGNEQITNDSVPISAATNSAAALFSINFFSHDQLGEADPPLADATPLSPSSSGTLSTTNSAASESPTESSSSSSSESSSLDSPPPDPPVRRSLRQNLGTLPNRLDDYVVYATNDLLIPRSYEEACKDPRWVAAMHEEIGALEENHTWDIVPRPAHAAVIGCRWVYTIKRHPDGSIDRYKARLVAQGFRQEFGVDYDETFAPVAKMQTVRTLLAIAAHRHWDMTQLDVKNAFLHGDLKEVVYLACPPGYHSSATNVVCLLRRSLYGLKQAPRAWFEKFQQTILSTGFTQSLNDPSLFTKRSVTGITALLLYVDDMILTGDDNEDILAVKQVLRDSFKLKDLSPLSYFLGLEVQRSSRGIFVCQRKYIDDLLTEAHHSICTPASTPMEINLKMSKEDGELLSEPTLYRKIVGSLIYLISTRPDIAYAVQVVSQFMGTPRKPHLDAVFRIMRYLQGTRGLGLFFPSTGSAELHAYADADYAGCVDTRRSTSGWCVKIGDSCIAWRCKKQERISKSSTEAEYRSMSEVCSEVVWLTRLLAELSYPVDLPVHLHADNTSAIQIASNPVLHDRTKHIETHVHYIRQLTQTGEVKIHYLNTEDQIADVLTKALATSRHWYLSTKLMCRDQHQFKRGC